MVSRYRSRTLCVLMAAGIVALSIDSTLAVRAEVKDARRIEFNHNYYGRLTPWEKELLRNNEEHHMRRAQLMMDRGEPVAYILNNLRYMQHRWPNHPEMLKLAAEIAVRTGDEALAVDFFERAINAYPAVAQPHIQYGVFLYRMGHLVKAAEQFQQALRLAPQSAEARYDLALTLLAEGRGKDALRLAREAYAMGYPLPGLRDKLRKAGLWEKGDRGERGRVGERRSGRGERRQE